MTYTVVPDKATNDVFTEAMWDTHIKDNFNKAVPRPIASTFLAVDTASIIFSAIPADWAHLCIMGYFRNTDATTWNQICVRFNGDSGANYDWQWLQGFSTSPGGGEVLGQSAGELALIPAGNAVANTFGALHTWIGNYAGSSNNKSYVSSSGAKFQNAASGQAWRSNCGHWRSNAAITQITILPLNAGNIAAGSKVTLYGLGN